MKWIIFVANIPLVFILNYIVYQAYGHRDILNEALYSMLSFMRFKEMGHYADVEMVLYTDSPDMFTEALGQRADLHLEIINAETIRLWRGDIDFVHRVKIMMLMDCFSKYDGNLLYADTDTVFMKDIHPLFELMAQGKLLMHAWEARVEEKNTINLRKLAAGLASSVFTTTHGATYTIPASTGMWNAGVLGLPRQYKHLLAEVLRLTDESYRQCPMHISEQFAFSYVLNKAGEVISTEAYVYHYWNFKEFRKVLAAFFDHNKGCGTAALLERMELIDPQVLHRPKLAYEALSKAGRFFKRLGAKPWQLPDYRLE